MKKYFVFYLDKNTFMFGWISSQQDLIIARQALQKRAFLALKAVAHYFVNIFG
jgi:hypothetical protein